MRVFFSDLWHLLLPHRVSRPGAKSVSRSSWRLRAQTNAFARIPGVPERPGPGHMSRSRDCFDSRGDAGIREKTQMFHLQWFRTRGVNRGKPGLPGGHGRRLALLGFLIATSLLETGCQSDPCSPCGFSGFIGRTTSFITRPFRRDRGGCCGSEVVAEEDAFRVEYPSERRSLRSSFRAPRSFPARRLPRMSRLRILRKISTRCLRQLRDKPRSDGCRPARAARAAPSPVRATKPFVPIRDRTVLVAITWPTR